MNDPYIDWPADVEPPEGETLVHTAPHEVTFGALWDELIEARRRRDEAIKAKHEAEAIAQMMRVSAFAAINPANWQAGEVSDATRLAHYEKTLAEIADHGSWITTLEEIFAPLIEQRDAALALVRRFLVAAGDDFAARHPTLVAEARDAVR